MSVITFAEQRDGKLRQVTFETLAAARSLADQLSVEVTTVLLGPPGIDAEAAALGRHGADRVLVGNSDAFSEYAPEALTDVLAGVVERENPTAVLFAATAIGKDLAPRVAARVKAGLASDVTELSAAGGSVEAVRPVYAGKAFARVAFTAAPALISVRPKAFRPAETGGSAQIEELALDIDAAALRTRVSRVAGGKAERLDVAEADIVVSGGRGMQGPEHWSMLEELVAALGPTASLGASRAVVDAGWRGHGEQVGQTGKVVSPQLYFAIGISGAIQHLAGMRTAECVVAVNKDAEAPIFKLATYGIVGDLFEIVPALAEAVSAAKG